MRRHLGGKFLLARAKNQYGRLFVNLKAGQGKGEHQVGGWGGVHLSQMLGLAGKDYCD